MKTKTVEASTWSFPMASTGGVCYVLPRTRHSLMMVKYVNVFLFLYFCMCVSVFLLVCASVCLWALLPAINLLIDWLIDWYRENVGFPKFVICHLHIRIMIISNGYKNRINRIKLCPRREHKLPSVLALNTARQLSLIWGIESKYKISCRGQRLRSNVTKFNHFYRSPSHIFLPRFLISSLSVSGRTYIHIYRQNDRLTKRQTERHTNRRR